MHHPKDVGDRTTLAVMITLRHAGYGLLLPVGKNTRYDLVIEVDERLATVQCRSGRLRGGAVRWSMCSNYAHHRSPPAVRRDYLGEVDFFGVYCVETGGVYLIPIGDALLRREAPYASTRRRTISGNSSATRRSTKSGAWTSTRPSLHFD
jgi:hypothetical protein